MIFEEMTTTTNAVTKFFSGKKIDIPVIDLAVVNQDLEFNSCLIQCVPPLKVFTDGIGTDFYKNDIYRLYLNQIPGGSVRIKLFKGSDEYLVTDNTYGSRETEVLDIWSYDTYEFQFFKIEQALGYGLYYFTIENLNGAGTVVQSKCSPKFRLLQYSDIEANRTIRVETIQKGFLVHGDKYPKSFNQQIRLPGRLDFSNMSTELDDLIINDVTQSRQQISTVNIPEYTLSLDMVSSNQIARVLFNYLMAGNVKISDYNVYNHNIDPINLEANRLRSIPLKPKEPSFEVLSDSVRRSYSITMEYSNSNIEKYI